MGIASQLSCLVVVAAVTAQEPVRERAFGMVRTAAGEPWANAEVHLLHRAHPGVLAAAYADHVTVQTDERGRFGVPLLTGMPYSVWAQGPVEHGRFRCTKVLADIVQGVPIVLQEGTDRFVRHVAFDRDASWTKPLQIVAKARVGSFSLQLELEVSDAGLVTTPAWPAETCKLALREGRRSVFETWVPTSMARAQRAAHGSADGDAEVAEPDLGAAVRIAVGARRELPVRFVDAQGTPVAGVEARAESRPPRRVLGRSDQDGVLRLVVAGAGVDRVPYRSVVLGPGCAESRLEQREFGKTAAGEVMVKVLGPGRSVQGRLLFGAGQPLASAPLVLQGSIQTGKTSTWFGVDPRLLQSGADGAVVVPGRIGSHPFRLSAVLSPAQRAALAAGGGKAPPVWPLALIHCERPGEPADLGDIDLATLAAIDIQVQAPDGTPPGSVRLVVVPLCDQARSLPHEPEVVRTDRHGRVRLLAARTVDLLIHATTRQGAAMAIVTPAQRSVALRIDPAHAVRFRVVDLAGAPVGGVYLHLVAPDQLSRALGSEQRAFERIRDLCRVHAFPWKGGRTDADGCVDLVMPAVDVLLDLSLDHRELGINRRINVELPRQREPGVIELELERKQ